MSVRNRIALGIIILQQFFFVTAYLPFKEWFSKTLIYSDDFIIHYGGTLIQNRIIDTQGFSKIWGYLPFFRAGTVTLTLLSIDSKAWGIFARLLSGLISYEAGFKLFFIISVLLIPVALYYSAKNFGFNERESLAATVLGTLYLQTSICVDFIKWGTVSFVFASYMSLFAVSILNSYFEKREIRKLFYFTVLCIVTFWIHILAAIAVAVPVFFLLITKIRFFSSKGLTLSLFVSFGVILLMTYPIYHPLLLFFDLRTNFFPWDPYFTTSPWEPVKTYIFQYSIFNDYTGIPFKKNTLFDLLLLLLTFYGFREWFKTGKKSILFCLAGAFVCFFLLGFYGSFKEFTKRLTPLRFIITMNVFLSLPAAAGLISFYDLINKGKGKVVKNITWIVSLILLTVLLFTPYYHFYVRKDFRLTTEEPAGVRPLVEMIKNNTTTKGRILCENSDWESGHMYFGGHFAVLFPDYTGREFVGSEYSTDPMKDSFVSFYDGFLFHEKFEWYDREKIGEYCDLYNIKWIMCWSPAAVRFIESFPDYIGKKAQSGVFRLYEVKRPENYFLKGSGEIDASINSLKLSNLKPDAGEVIISYHWIKTLKTDPTVEMKETRYLDDPVGFVRLINPPADITIYNGY